MSKNNIKVVTVAGTRPEIIKLANIIPLLNERYDHALVYTGQHYSQNMRDIFIDELNFKFDHDLKSNTSDILTINNLMLPTIKKNISRLCYCIW